MFLGINLKAQQIIDLCPDTKTTFTYSSSAGVDGTYQWTVGSDVFFGNPFIYKWTQPGEFTIYLSFMSYNNCIDTLSYNVLVMPCEETYVYAPNSFTPNGDG